MTENRITVRAAAALSGKGIRTVRRWYLEGKLPFQKSATGGVYIMLDDLENFLGMKNGMSTRANSCQTGIAEPE
jgi:hypothetical protein